VITGLDFYDFKYAIVIACPDSECGTGLFSNNQIINNTISSQHGEGITITWGGLRPAEEALLFSDIIWQGTVIRGNSISTKGSAM